MRRCGERRWLRLGGAALLVVCAWWLATAGGAFAATYNVNTTADGASNCGLPVEPCTLRDAFTRANNDADPEVINVPAGTYDLNGPDLILSTNEKAIVQGAGARSTIIREVGGGDGRIFLLEQASQMTIRGFTLTGATASAIGALFPELVLNADGLAIVGNRGPQGGGVQVGTPGATVNFSNSLISSNTAEPGGGPTSGRGGGLVVDGASAVTLTNTTVSGNQAVSGGGLFVDEGTLTLDHATVNGNQSAGGGTSLTTDVGAGMADPPGTSRARNTIVDSCAGRPVESQGSNLERGETCGLTGAGDLRNTDPRLGGVQNNGGQTDTYALLPGSPAIDAASGCPPPGSDQRGVIRPQGPRCDIGAFEAEVATVPQMTGLGIKRTPFNAAGAGPQVMQVPNRRLDFGSTVFYRINLAGRVTFVIDRASTGRRVGSECLPRSGSDFTSPGCRRYIRQEGSIGLPARAGYNAFYLRGRLAGRSLPHGNYRLLATPTANGNTGAAASVTFAIT